MVLLVLLLIVVKEIVGISAYITLDDELISLTYMFLNMFTVAVDSQQTKVAELTLDAKACGKYTRCLFLPRYWRYWNCTILGQEFVAGCDLGVILQLWHHFEDSLVQEKFGDSAFMRKPCDRIFVLDETTGSRQA